MAFAGSSLNMSTFFRAPAAIDLPYPGCQPAAAAVLACFAVSQGGAKSRRLSLGISPLRNLHEVGIRERPKETPGLGIFTAAAACCLQGRRTFHRAKRQSHVECLALSSPLQMKWTPNSLSWPARSLVPSCKSSVRNGDSYMDMDGEENGQGWRRRRRRSDVFCPLACAARATDGPSGGGEFSSETEEMVQSALDSKNNGAAPKPAKRRVGRPSGSTKAGTTKSCASRRKPLKSETDDSERAADNVAGGGRVDGTSGRSATEGLSSPPPAVKKKPQADPGEVIGSSSRTRSSKSLSRQASGDLVDTGMTAASASVTNSNSKTGEKSSQKDIALKTKGAVANYDDEIVTSLLRRGKRRGNRKPRGLPRGEGGAGRRGASGFPSAASEVVANSVMRTQRAFEKNKNPSKSATGNVSPVGDKKDGGGGGGGDGKGEQHQQEVNTKDVLGGVVPTQRISERSITKGRSVAAAAAAAAAAATPELVPEGGDQSHYKNKHKDNMEEQAAAPPAATAAAADDGFVLKKDNVIKPGSKDNTEDTQDLLLDRADVAAILAERNDRLSSQRSAQGLDGSHCRRDADTNGTTITAPSVDTTSTDNDQQEADGGGGGSHFGSDNSHADQVGVGGAPPPASPAYREYDAKTSSPKGVVCPVVEETTPTTAAAGALAVTSATPVTAESGEGAGEGAGEQLGGAMSLKKRLGMSDAEVEALRGWAHRSGLANDRAVEKKLTGAASGGPKTAIGYLLGDLRMKPGEVKEAVIRCPALLKLTDRGPHGVASWLQGGLGLSADDVAKMFRRHPSMLTYSIVHNLRPKFREACRLQGQHLARSNINWNGLLRWLQEDLGLSRARAIRLVLRCPAIFGLSIEDNMLPKVQWLTEELFMTKREAASVIFGNPGVLLSSIERSLEPKIAWLENNLSMQQEMVIDMIRRYPMFFSLSSEDNLGPKIDWLSAQASSDIVRRAIFRQPSLLGHNAQGNLAPKVQWLQDRLGMSEKAAWTLIGRSPGFLTLSVSDTLEPKLWWLRDKLDMTLQGAAKLVAAYPTLFDLSIEDSLEPKLWWVRDALGLDRPDAAAVLRRCPQIFGSSLKDTLEPKLSWLTRRLQTTRERVAAMVLKFPQLLTYSIDDNLAPTIDFFEHEMGNVEPEQLLSCLEARPSALSASLGKRLTVRIAKMRSGGVEPALQEHLRAVTSLTDAQFKAWLVKNRAKARSRSIDNKRAEGELSAAGMHPRDSGRTGSSAKKAPPKSKVLDISGGRTTSTVVVGRKYKNRPTVETQKIAAENP